MKQLTQIFTAISILILLMIFTACSSIDHSDAPKQNEVSSITEKENKPAIVEENNVKFYRTTLAESVDVEFPLNLTIDFRVDWK